MRPLPALAALFALSLPAAANDGWGGLSATGLTFGQTDAVALLAEDLFISPEKVSVDYLFRNTTDADVTGEVIFPLPPVPVWSGYEGMMNLPEDLTRDNLVEFTAVVDGRSVAVKIDRIAVLEEPWDENRPPSAQYDNPGRDVTADLERLGLPLTLEVETLRAALMALGPEQRAEATALGLAEYIAADPAAGLPEEVWAAWSIVTRYHWTQTFPAGEEVWVHHDYLNLPPGGLFYWSEPPEDWQDQLREMYCIDAGTSKAILKALEQPDPESGNYGTAFNISYVLRTANSWAGPIGRFRLTLDKGAVENVISLCAEGVRKTGPTTFVVEKTDYTPEQDLQVLVVVPIRD